MNAAVNRALSGNRNTLPPLTGIRFFAAFHVVLFHALPWLDSHLLLPVPVRIFLNNGYLAVCLFFLLSGFILSYTYEGHSSGGSNRAKFWESRFARIYPVYFLSLLLALPFHWQKLTSSTVAAVLLMVQAWNPLRPEISGAWNYPAWSLSIEAFFYLCFPFVQSCLAKVSRNTLLILGGFAALIAIFGHTPTQGLGTWDQTSIAGKWIPLPVLRFPEFLIGMVLGNVFLRDRATSKKTFLTTFAALFSLLLLSIPIGSWVSLVVLPFGLLIYCLASSRDFLTALLSRPLMLLLGGASYSVYLLQAPVRDYVRVLIPRLSLRLVAFGVPLTPLILILFSILVFRIWEEPMRHSIRRWLALIF